MSKLPSAASAAAMVGIVGSNWIAGGIAGLSHFAIPGLLSTSAPGTVLAQQWRTIFDMGKAAMPGVALVSVAAYAYTAWDRSKKHLYWPRYALAGALTIAIIPFTLIFMHPTNQALLQIAGGGTTAAVVNDDSVRALITKWAGLNLIRSLLPLAGGVVGLWAVVQERVGSLEVGSKQAGGSDVTKSHPAAASKATGGDDVSKSHPASL